MVTTVVGPVEKLHPCGSDQVPGVERCIAAGPVSTPVGQRQGGGRRGGAELGRGWETMGFDRETTGFQKANMDFFIGKPWDFLRKP